MSIIVCEPHVCQQTSVLIWERGFSKLALPSDKDSVFHNCTGKTIWRNQHYCALEQSVPEGLHPVEGTHAAVVREELHPVGRTHIGELHGGLFPMGGTPR